jgi:hypothetical protein
MAKESGMAWTTLTVDDSSGAAKTGIKNDLVSVDFQTPRGVQDVTGLDKSAMERLLLLADFSINLNGIFNDGANQSHAVFKTVSSSSVARTVTMEVSGQSIPNETFFTDYQLTRPATGELTYVAPGVLTGGVVPTWS